MQQAYETTFRTRSVSQPKLYSAILALYSHYNCYKPYSFDEILFILDQKSQLKCDRAIAKEIFNQCSDAENKSNLNVFIRTYIENLQTAKLFLLRDEATDRQLHKKVSTMEFRKNTYVYLKMLRITVHSRFSRNPSLEYRIVPSDIPPVMVINSLSPTLNQQFTLQLEGQSFNIVFYDSGVEILTWTFPESIDFPEGEYEKTVDTQNVTFSIRVKYLPRGKTLQMGKVQRQLAGMKDKMTTNQEAFSKLCNFEPFLAPCSVPISNTGGTIWWRLTNTLIQCLPLLGRHLRNLHFTLFILLFFQCLASTVYSMQFLDISIAIYILGLLYDQTVIQFGLQLIVIELGLALLLFKSIWVAFLKPSSSVNTQGGVVLIAIVIVLKLVVIFLVWLCEVRKEELALQRMEDIYKKQTQQLIPVDPLKDIWDCEIK